MVKNIMMVMLILIGSSSAYADDYDNFNSDGEDYSKFNSSADDKYRDWKNVLSMLASQGIDASAVDWSAIAPLCADKKNQAPDKYNKCKYNNAINYDQYNKDISYCDATAEQRYFDYIRADNGGATASNGQYKKNFKGSWSILCMRNLGWNDAGSWQAGKRENIKRHKSYR